MRVAALLATAAALVASASFCGARARHNAKASVAVHRVLCRVLGVRLRRFGTPGPARRLIVANHVSWLDILVLGAIEPMAFLAKKEVGSSRWTRWLVDLQGVVYVDRERRRGIPRVNVEIARRMNEGSPVALFAEATTSDGTRLLRFRSSHFEAARPAGTWVQPVYLDYRAVAGVCATRAERARLAWYGDAAFLPSLRQVLASGGVSCDVHYGEVIAGDGASDRKALAKQAEASIRALKARARRGFLREQTGTVSRSAVPSRRL